MHADVRQDGEQHHRPDESPYNVELVDENHYRIAIAVAGFAESELEITAQDNLLVVKGAHA
ncbi:Hsp20 family protein, partial [Salmonella enterica subsp. enterica serovar Montevideo]|nr:Hsp20 family protein [Salmonella enterica subsp. enterica serovar Montevideo]